MYTSFMEAGAVEFESEAKRFLEDGYYNSVVGDTMPLALATALHAYLIIFTTDPENPFMYVTPDSVSNVGTLFLVYTPFGSGHYDATLPFYSPPQQPLKDSVNTCSCGVNTQDQGRQSCVPIPQCSTRYSCTNFRSRVHLTVVVKIVLIHMVINVQRHLQLANENAGHTHYKYRCQAVKSLQQPEGSAYLLLCGQTLRQ